MGSQMNKELQLEWKREIQSTILKSRSSSNLENSQEKNHQKNQRKGKRDQYLATVVMLAPTATELIENQLNLASLQSRNLLSGQ